MVGPPTPCDGGIAIPARNPRTRPPSTAEAGAWAEVLVRHQLLHAAVLAPNGQWLAQDRPESPVRVLDGPAAMVELAAEIQHRIRTTRNRTR
ncbi:hypothetical protein [Streptomyces sp. ADI98-10]|uniref:hypothetical protein n=1 Tax=Streptomyces sp. ADI98-10 TaxID=1522763 RepID=UPI000F551B0D|nr:hypothetical protein [Streptomyces sp. ADI98-10]RPK92280.1 hypothetical protein EES46_09535 [Streptomyces sp. ADI98-10]